MIPRFIKALLAVPIAVLLIGAPAVAATDTPPPVSDPVVSGITSNFVKIGVATTATITSDGFGTVPTKYEYWVNNGKHKTVKADASGRATIYLTFTTNVNGLSVEGIDASGNTGYVTFNYYYADGATPAATNDSNGDGVPDLLTVGDPTGLGSGIWLAKGNPAGYLTGRIRVPAVNVGADGLADNDPTYFDGAHVITGNFLSDNLQDVWIYFTSGPKAGAGVVLPGTGDGSVMRGFNGLNLGLDYLTDANGDEPIDLANAYNSSNLNNATPDLIGISGSAADGYHLTTYPSWGWPGGYSPELTANTTPTGGTDWQNWQLVSTSTPSGTAIFLWNSATGALYLWQGVTFTDNGDGTSSVSYTQYQIAKKWNAGATFSTIEAADFTGDGVPDLWTVTAAGVARAYVVSDLSTTSLAHISAKAPQNLS